MPTYACQLCKQEGHWVSRCPLLQQASLLVAPTMASEQPPPPPPAAPKDKPRAYAARIDDEYDDDDDDEFGGEYLPLVALAGVRGGPGRNPNHPGPAGGYQSTGSIGTNGEARRAELGAPSSRSARYDAAMRRARNDRARKTQPPGENFTKRKRLLVRMV